MRVKIGTFNLNNLFSRFNFAGAVNVLQKGSGSSNSFTIKYEFTDPETFKIRTFQGKLIKAKKKVDSERVRDRILEMDVDVLAVQEVENIHILRQFNRDELDNLYPYAVLVEGNDPRFIDVGLLSKLPVGPVTSHQHAVHPSNPDRPVFGRDLLEVEILSPNRTMRLFTIFNNHLKSHFVPRNEDPVEGKAKADARRQRQAETVAMIVERRTWPDDRFIVLGDMNDPQYSQSIKPLVESPELDLVNALSNPKETREPKAESTGPGPQTAAWTYRYKESGEAPEFHLYDQIWLSPSLSQGLQDAWIDRRTRHGGDGSDHDPAWIELAL